MKSTDNTNMLRTSRARLAIVISGRGSNMVSILNAWAQNRLFAEPVLVVSNREQAQGLARAAEQQIPTAVVDDRDYPGRAQFDQALATMLDQYAVDIVALAGFMRILTADFVSHYTGRLVNIHPSLLPALTGLNTHARAIADGHREHGASVHFVTATLDRGPIIAQARVPICAEDDAERLAAKVLEQEHRLYPLALEWLARGRVRMTSNATVELDGKPLPCPFYPLESDLC